MRSSWVVLVFCAYFAALIGIALLRSRRMRDMAEYALGSRRLSAFTAGLSAGSSATSAWTMLSLPALVYISGAVAIWIPIFTAFGIWLSWVVLARRLRRYTIEANDVLTLPEFFEVRFGDTTGILRTLTSLVTVLFVIFWLCSGFIGGSKLLETVFGIEAATGVVLTFAAIASYTLIGGFLAVSRTDVFQALLMLTSLLVVTITLFASTENPFSGTGGSSTGFLEPFADGGVSVALVFVFSTAGWAFGAFGSQRTLQRFMALEREDKHVQGRNISTLWLVAVLMLAIGVGLLAPAALSEAGLTTEMDDPERVYLVVSEVFFHPIVTGVLLTAVIAAVMSTADSQLLLASAIATGDMPFVRRFADTATGSARVTLSRLLLFVIGLIAVVVSVSYEESVFDLVSYAWGGMGAALGPVTILALYWRRFNSWGAGASIVTGTAVASVWGYLEGGPSGIWDIQPASPGFLIAMLVAAVVCVLTPQPSREVVELFDRVNSDRRESRAPLR